MSSLLTGWSTLREPQSLAFLHSSRNETLQSCSEAHGLKLRGLRGWEWTGRAHLGLLLGTMGTARS